MIEPCRTRQRRRTAFVIFLFGTITLTLIIRPEFGALLEQLVALMTLIMTILESVEKMRLQVGPDTNHQAQGESKTEE